MFSSWFGSKPKSDEETYKSQLAILASKRYMDKQKNIKKLKFYKGDIKLVMMDCDANDTTTIDIVCVSIDIYIGYIW